MHAVDFENLSGAQQKAVVEAIRLSFDEDQLQMLLGLRLEKNLNDLARLGTWEHRVFQVVRASQMQGFGTKLVDAVEVERPDAPRITGLRTTLGLLQPQAQGAPREAGASLEKIVRDRSTMRDFGRWLDSLVKIQRRVCRIEGKNFGTGFLVGDDLVLTNYHVVEPEAKGWASAAELACRFDYSTHDGADHPGKLVKVAKDWLVKSAPYSAADVESDAGTPQPGELDFALMRLTGPVEPAANGGPTRGFMPLSAEAPTVKEGDIVFIVQHPQGSPLTLASGVVEKPTAGGLRIRYDANTEGGSSGAPVFDASLNLVSLHHAGDPNWKPTYNQGIPIGLIGAALKTTDVEKPGPGVET